MDGHAGKGEPQLGDANATVSPAPALLRTLTPAVVALIFSLFLVRVGYRLFVDATAAVVYNADERIPEAVHGAWAYAAVWGIGNGALAYWAYRRGLARRGREVAWLAGSGLLILDLSFLGLLSVRDAGLAAVLGIAIQCAVFGGLVYLAWRRPRIGGVLLGALGFLFGFSALFGSATTESERNSELLFDEDLFYVLSVGLVPFLCGLLWLASRSPRSRKPDVPVEEPEQTANP